MGRSKPKGVKQKEYSAGTGFPVAAMRLYSDKRVLVLLSENRDIIEYIDIINYKTIHHLITTTHESLGSDVYSLRKTAISFDCRVLLLGTNKEECCMIEIPLQILYNVFFEKIMAYSVFKQSGMPEDIRKLIWYFLLNVLRKK